MKGLVHRSVLRRAAVLAAVAAVPLLAIEAAADHCSRGQGTLTGPPIGGQTPQGKAEWKGNSFCQPLEMKIEVSKVNLPDGTVLSVDACGSTGTTNIVGTIRLQGGSGKLQLSKLDGDPANDNVPFCDMRFGSPVRILHGSTAILSGCVSSPDIPGAPPC
jgi:hypothetical protein